MKTHLIYNIEEKDLEPVSVTISTHSWLTYYTYSVSAFTIPYIKYDITLFLSIDNQTIPEGHNIVAVTLSDFLGKTSSYQLNIYVTKSGTINFNPASVEGMWGWWVAGNWVTQSSTRSQISVWYDSSPNGHHLVLDLRNTTQPWDTTLISGPRTGSFILTRSDHVLYSFSRNPSFFWSGSSLNDGWRYEHVLGNKSTSFYSSEYSVFFVYQNHVNPPANLVFIDSMTASGPISVFAYNNIDNSSSVRHPYTYSIIPYTPFMLNRFAPYNDSFGTSNLNDFNLHGGWCMAFCIPPYAIDPSERSAYILTQTFSSDRLFGFGNYAASIINTMFQPYVLIFKLYTRSTLNDVNVAPTKLFYYTIEEYETLSAIEKNNLVTRFLFTKNQWCAVGYVVKEDPIVINGTISGASYTYSIYFNETVSSIKHAVMFYTRSDGVFLSDITTHAFIDGTSNNETYSILYGGVATGPAFSMLADYFLNSGAANFYNYMYWFPTAYSLSLREIIFFTRALFTEAPLIMDYLMKKNGIPYLSNA